jgi:hypothetical protein
MINMELSYFVGSGAVHEGVASLPVRSTLHAGVSDAKNVEPFDDVLPLSSSDEQPHNMVRTAVSNMNLIVFI